MGAGPAGASAALSLASTCRVVLLDRWLTPPSRIGESLAPAARRLLLHMELWDDFLRQGHAPAFLKQSRWGSSELTFADSMRDLDGPGFCLDRPRFESFLRDAALARGAELLAPLRVTEIAATAEGFRVRAEAPEQHVTIDAPVLIDAAGRGSRCLYGLGATRVRLDRTFCLFVKGQTAHAKPAVAYTESEPDGYWYTTRIPDGRRVLAFHTDADLPIVRDLRPAAALLRRAHRSPTLRDMIADATFDEEGVAETCAAHSSLLSAGAGMVGSSAAWFAVGDAVMSFDPLASQGLFHALFTGLTAARAVARLRAGDATAVDTYNQSLAPIWEAYLRHLSAVYAQERRFGGRSFWQRRHT